MPPESGTVLKLQTWNQAKVSALVKPASSKGQGRQSTKSAHLLSKSRGEPQDQVRPGEGWRPRGRAEIRADFQGSCRGSQLPFPARLGPR